MNKPAQLAQESPRINRFITEFTSSPYFFVVKVSMVSFFSLVLFVGIVQQTHLLLENKNVLTIQSQERQRVANEISWWEGVAMQYQGYRDVYLQIATLQYQLGDRRGADESLGKVLELDPNSQDALVLREKLSL